MCNIVMSYVTYIYIYVSLLIIMYPKITQAGFSEIQLHLGESPGDWNVSTDNWVRVWLNGRTPTYIYMFVSCCSRSFTICKNMGVNNSMMGTRLVQTPLWVIFGGAVQLHSPSELTLNFH